MRIVRQPSRETRASRPPGRGPAAGESRWGSRLRLVRRLAILGVVAVLAGLLVIRGREFLFTSSYFKVQNITIDGVSEKVGGKVRSALAAEGGPRNLLEASPGMVQELVLAVPEIKDVTVRRRLPDTLIISAIERVPVAILVGEDNSVVDGDLVVIGTISGWEFLNSSLPLITLAAPPAIKPGERISDSRVGRALAVVAELRRKSPELAMDLSETHADEAGDLTLFFTGGAEVRLGQRKLSQALPVLEAVAKELGGLDHLEYAELRYRNQVAFKRRAAPAPEGASAVMKAKQDH